MNRELLRLQRQLIDGPVKGGEPFDRYAYNVFSHQAHHCFKRAKTQDEKDLCELLRKIAVRKSKELLAQEQAKKAQQSNA
jgi:hypothetical protein